MNREELLSKFGEPTKILDHGMIRLVDVMGDDGAIVQAARVSYGKGTKSVSEDRGLIRYLLRHRHTSPFEMCEIKLHCKMPIFVARQWIRHRTANVNELSGRYSIMPNEMHLPSPTVIAMQSASNKQGREEESVGPEGALKFLAMLNDTQELVRSRYEEFINEGYARELSRTVLPLSQYTEWYWKIDLRNLLHFLSLRLDAHAQYEIRVYADAIADIVKEWVPLTWEAFEDYILYAEQFSKQELQILRGVLRSADLLGVCKPEGMSDREVQAFIEKLS